MRNEVTQRGVKYLLHFTRVENIGSILQLGIIPRATLEANAIQSISNDALRLDGCRDASCFSIAHPNYKMFYQLRQNVPGSEWIVLVCDARILWEKDCAFCVQNAASSSVSQIPIADRKGVVPFEQLFSEDPSKPSRLELGLPANCPTNPQAEVLVFGNVEPGYILGAACPTAASKDALQASYPNRSFIQMSSQFSARKDYKHWK